MSAMEGKAHGDARKGAYIRCDCFDSGILGQVRFDTTTTLLSMFRCFLGRIFACRRNDGSTAQSSQLSPRDLATLLHVSATTTTTAWRTTVAKHNPATLQDSYRHDITSVTIRYLDLPESEVLALSAPARFYRTNLVRIQPRPPTSSLLRLIFILYFFTQL